MKSVKIVLVLIVILNAASGSLSAAQAIVLVTDNSPADSPLRNSGTCTLSEAAASGQTMISFGQDWTVENISQRPIMAIVETLLVRFSNGHFAENTLQREAFFDETLINPGTVLRLSPSGQESGTEVIKGQYLQVSEPACEITARWVQFGDGTTFGDRKYAEELLQVRATIYAALARLNRVYRTQGQEKFLQELQKPIQPVFANSYIDHLRDFQRQHGAQATFQRLSVHLKVAEERSHNLNAQLQ